MQFLVKLECYFNAMFSPAATVAGELTGGYAPPPKQNAAVIKWR